ncbi:MAG TPA: hypothetical protein VEB86_01115 [Chryseosolibacter sp.]|nr:hypothetical protein [Chryseosolibacter sp.]
MAGNILPEIEAQIKSYQREHRGERPLYIVLPADDAQRLMSEVRTACGFAHDTIVTEVHGSKIVQSPAMSAGQIQLTNELPDIAS